MFELMALEEAHGVFLACEAEALGYNDKALRKALQEGLLWRVRRGAYVFADTWSAADSLTQHLITADAVMRTAGCRAVFSHTTAAVCLGADIWDLPLGDVHLTRRDGKAGRREAGVIQHRGRLGADETCRQDGRPCTAAARTAFDVTTITDAERALVVVNSLLHQGRTTPEELMAVADANPAAFGSLRANVVLKLADPRIESPGESRTLYALWRQGIPMPQPQYEVFDGSGTSVGRVDFAWPELGIWLEFDGKEKYVKFLRPGETVVDAVMREKKREDLIRRLTGWSCIRITWADLSNPARLARTIREAMAARQSA